MKWNIPNILTIVRFLLIPVFLWVYLTAVEPEQFMLAALVLTLSGITDVLDGQIARRYNMETAWGRAADPVADKATQIAVAFAVWHNYPQLVYVFGLVFIKELSMIAGGIGLYRKFNMIKSARWFGKLATLVFYLVHMAIVAMGTSLSDQIITILMVVVVGFMLFAGLMYIVEFIRIAKEQKK